MYFYTPPPPHTHQMISQDPVTKVICPRSPDWINYFCMGHDFIMHIAQRLLLSRWFDMTITRIIWSRLLLNKKPIEIFVRTITFQWRDIEGACLAQNLLLTKCFITCTKAIWPKSRSLLYIKRFDIFAWVITW